MVNSLTIIERVWEKFVGLLQYPLAWAAGLALFIMDAFSGSMFVVYIVVIASVIDLLCGIAVSIKKKCFARSELMRQTVEKMVVYGLALVVFICIDYFIENKTNFTMDITSGLVGVVISLTETVSFMASLLILFPNNPFLQIFQKALTGEIARKLGIDEQEVEKTLKAARKKKKPARAANGQFISKK